MKERDIERKKNLKKHERTKEEDKKNSTKEENESHVRET